MHTTGPVRSKPRLIFYFCRHGQTNQYVVVLHSHVPVLSRFFRWLSPFWNRLADSSNQNRLVQGQLDTPLNALGQRQSARLAEAMRDITFFRAYSSPLTRARQVGPLHAVFQLTQTAWIVLAGHAETSMRLDPALKQRHLGDLQGVTRIQGADEPANAETVVEWASAVVYDLCADGSLEARVRLWLAGILIESTLGRGPWGTNDRHILVVTHGGWINALTRILTTEYPALQLAVGVDPTTFCANTSVLKMSACQEGGMWTGEILSIGDTTHLQGLTDVESGENGVK